jgi:diguanylate cyclase (GGDEF)-like protein/PAS domain S-box-containing protein
MDSEMTRQADQGADAGARRYALWLAVAYVCVAALCALVIHAEFRQIDHQVATLARERGSALFHLVELMRDWNAGHGAVYVPATEVTQPNPYLKHPKRDALTTDGVLLTMVNPAYMTRQLAEIAEQADGVKFHITSLKTIRPANAADPWESEALRLFEQGRSEVLEEQNVGGVAVHRYMAPLYIKQPCLKCHAELGYKLGDVRGGISVTMPADKILAIRATQRQRVVLTFGGAAVAIALLLHFAASRSRRHFLHLREVSAGQERLIAERTQALSDANDHLRDEVAERKRQELQIRESEARYRSVIETSQNAFVIIQAPDSVITFANEQAGALLGLEMIQIIGQPLLSFVTAQDRESVAERLARRFRGEPAPPVSRIHFARPDGSNPRVGDVHLAPIDGAGEPAQWVFSIKDITERLADEQALQISAAVMESASEGIIVTDAARRIIQVNPAFTAITGYRPHEVMNKDLRFLGSGRHDAEFFRVLWQKLESDGHWEGEVSNRRPDGSVYVVWLSISAISGDLPESRGRHVATFIDISQRKEIEELLRHRAQSDPLTDLPNRSLFYDRLQVALNQAHRYGRECALLYIDLDYFKGVNDRMGHAAGDQLLVETAHRLVQEVRESDTVARLGGDEFAVILPMIGGWAEVEEVAGRVVAALGQPFVLPGGEARISASVGVAIYPEHGADLEHICASADAALYAVKEAGRNGYRLAENSAP